MKKKKEISTKAFLKQIEGVLRLSRSGRPHGPLALLASRGKRRVKTKEEKQAEPIQKVTRELVEMQDKLRREIAFGEKDPSPSRHDALRLRYMRLVVALGDKYVEAASRMIETARQEAAKAKNRPKRVRRPRRTAP